MLTGSAVKSEPMWLLMPTKPRKLRRLLWSREISSAGPSWLVSAFGPGQSRLRGSIGTCTSNS